MPFRHRYAAAFSRHAIFFLRCLQALSQQQWWSRRYYSGDGPVAERSCVSTLTAGFFSVQLSFAALSRDGEQANQERKKNTSGAPWGGHWLRRQQPKAEVDERRNGPGRPTQCKLVSGPSAGDGEMAATWIGAGCGSTCAVCWLAAEKRYVPGPSVVGGGVGTARKSHPSNDLLSARAVASKSGCCSFPSPPRIILCGPPDIKVLLVPRCFSFFLSSPSTFAIQSITFVVLYNYPQPQPLISQNEVRFRCPHHRRCRRHRRRPSRLRPRLH